jgi:hypothetical protein
MAESHLRQDHGARAYPRIVPNVDQAQPTMLEECVVQFSIVPIVGGTVKEVMTRGRVQRMVRRTNPGKSSNISKLTDPRVRNVGIPITIAARGYDCHAVKLPMSVLGTLLQTTKTKLASFIANQHFGDSYAVNLHHAHEELQDLVKLELISPSKDLDR